MGLIGCLIVVATLLHHVTAEEHTVGGELLWTIPPAGSIAYTAWARTRSFDLGDTILFNWTGTHDVAKVSKADYDNCTKTNPIVPIVTTSPANFTVTNETQYFICTVSTHCNLGQKVTIGLESSAASSHAIGALSAILVAVAISFLSFM